MRKLIILLALTTIYCHEANAQGCVAIRSNGASCAMTKPHEGEGQWLFTTNYRYFKSFRHFKGTEEEKERVEQGTEVINYSHALDLTLTRLINARWSITVDLPLLANSRSSLY